MTISNATAPDSYPALTGCGIAFAVARFLMGVSPFYFKYLRFLELTI